MEIKNNETVSTEEFDALHADESQTAEDMAAELSKMIESTVNPT